MDGLDLSRKVSLHQVWSAPLQDVERVLKKVGCDLSNNLNFNRILVAAIYHNMEMLTSEDV